MAILAFSHLANRPASCPPPSHADGLPIVSAAGDGQPQVVNLTIQYPCYYPDHFSVRRGVPVVFHVGTIGEPGCGRQLVMQGLGISKMVSPGTITAFEFTPERAGRYGITCGMGMMKPAAIEVID
jgi:plastocyanin domain-containing protein